MRSACGAFGLGAAIAIALVVAIFNFQSSGGEFAGLLMALVSAVIAIAGFVSPALAAYLWKFNRAKSFVSWVFGIFATAFSLLWDNLGAVAWALGAKGYLPSDVAFSGGIFAHLFVLLCLVLWVAPEGEERSGPAGEGRSAPTLRANEVDSAHEAINSVSRTLTLLMEPARGKRVDLAAVYARYQAAILKEGGRPECQSVFQDAVHALCEATAIRVQIASRKVYLSGVKIAD